MRILLINHFPLEGSGSGIYTQNVARELTQKGHEAFVIAPGHEEHSGFPFQVHTILFSASGESGADDQRLPFNFPCFTTHPLSKTTYGDLSPDQRQEYVDAFCQATAERVSGWNPDAIHAQHLWVSGFAALQTGVPYVATAHGTDLMGIRKYESWKEIAFEGAAQARAIIAISKQVAQDTQRLYHVESERMRLILNGFDEAIFRVLPLDRSEVLAEHEISGEFKHVVTFVGKLAEFKGVDVLLDAAAFYEERLEDVLTLIVGDGELRDRLQAQAERLGLKEVHFLGHQPQTEVARLYNLADVSVVPSRVEPFGLVAVEALACGTPVVATNAGGLPDFINELVGALVEVDDPQDLAAAIVAEVRSGAKKEKGPYAADYALEKFSWGTQVDKMIAVYRETTEAPSG